MDHGAAEGHRSADEGGLHRNVGVVHPRRLPARADRDGRRTGRGLQLDLRLADATAAKQLQTDLAELVKAGGTVCEVERGARGPADEVVQGRDRRKLADDPRFRAATSGGVPGATTALYFGGEPGSGPATSVGVTVGRDGADTVVMAKILVG